MERQIFFILVGFAFLFVLYLAYREPSKGKRTEQRTIVSREAQDTQKQAAPTKEKKK